MMMPWTVIKMTPRLKVIMTMTNFLMLILNKNTFESFNSSRDSKTGKSKPKKKEKPGSKPVFTTPLVRNICQFINTDKHEYDNSDNEFETLKRNGGCEYRPGEKIKSVKGRTIKKYLMYAWGKVETGSYVKINDTIDEDLDLNGVPVYGQVIEVFGTNSGNHMVHVQHLAERAVVDNNFYKNENE